MSGTAIGFLVVEKDDREAIEIAVSQAERIVNNSGFDYVHDTGEDYVALNIESEEGKKVLAEFIKNTKNAFLDNTKKLRELLIKWTNKELYAKDRDLFRYICRKVGEYWGPDIDLYDEDGAGLRTKAEIDEYFETTKAGLQDDEKIWIVSVYMKY